MLPVGITRLPSAASVDDTRDRGTQTESIKKLT